MKLPNLTELRKVALDNAKKYSPEILTGIGVAGFITTTVLAVKATPKAVKKLDARKEKLKKKKLPVTEVVRTVWKDYIPATVTGVASTACIIGASAVNHKRNMALATAYGLSEAALKTYQEKVVEKIGEKKEQAVRDEIAKDQLDRVPLSNSQVIQTGKGDALFFDTVSGRYFKSDIEKLRRIQAELNQRLTTEMYLSLNEFYFEIGLDPISIGDELGWNVNDSLISLDFSAQLTDDGTPCGVLSYCIAPRWDYRKLH